MTIQIETRGRRHYVLGNTYPIRAELRAAGCKWDPDVKAWYSGKRETVERFAARVSAGEVKAEAAYRRLDDGSWGVLVPGAATVGATVTVRTKAGSTKTETISAIVETTEQGTLCGVAPRARKERAPRQPGKVGQTEGAPYCSQYEGDKHSREPERKLGEACWLKHQGKRIAVVVVGYERAQWCSGDVLEDMGDYSHGGYGAWLGMLYYRDATPTEYAELQTSSPRADGVCLTAEVAAG